MTNRMSSTTVTFQRPFLLNGFATLQAAGTYTVDTEEEQIVDVSFAAWKRTSTVMQIARAGAIEHVPVDPAELHEALMRDGAQEHPSHPSSPSQARVRLTRARLAIRKKS